MKLSSGTANFWAQVGSYLLWAVVSVTVAFRWLGAELAGFMALVFFFGFIWFLVDIKAKLVRALPETWNGEPAHFEDFPFLNLSWLQQQTQDLEALGFIHLMDYKLGDNPCFGRCLAHPQHNCFAELGAIFTAEGQPFSQQTILMSFLSDGWSLSHVDRAPNAATDSLMRLWQNPRRLGIFSPDLTQAERLQAHLEFRSQMVQDLGITVLTDHSWEAFVQAERQAIVDRKRALKRKNLLLGMMQVMQYELNPQSEWLGRYAKIAMRRRARVVI